MKPIRKIDSRFDKSTSRDHAGDALVDPVCGMNVNPNEAAGSSEYKGKTYYFCSPHCLKKFSEEPERFLNNFGEEKTGHLREAKLEPKTPAISAFTCPMHPEVR